MGRFEGNGIAVGRILVADALHTLDMAEQEYANDGQHDNQDGGNG